VFPSGYPRRRQDDEVLAVIGFGVLPWRVASDCETCNDLNDGDAVDSVMLCAGYVPLIKGVCEGDSGGPIFDWEGVQVGAVS
jgi:secreted trypsin-like serine protease